VNLSDFLTAHKTDNLIYQALAIKNSRFCLGVFGSAMYFCALFGKDSYMLTLGRQSIEKINAKFSTWNRLVFNGRLHAIDCTMENVVDTVKAVKIYDR
jgi:hypothetical protein